jgi:hypothetical protein
MFGKKEVLLLGRSCHRVPLRYRNDVDDDALRHLFERSVQLRKDLEEIEQILARRAPHLLDPGNQASQSNIAPIKPPPPAADSTRPPLES